MQLNKSLIILFSLALFIPEIFSQVADRPYYQGTNSSLQAPGYYNPFYNNPIGSKEKLDFNFSAMSSFSSYSNFGSVFSNTFSPSLNYKVSKKFSVQGGVSISYKVHSEV